MRALTLVAALALPQAALAQAPMREGSLLRVPVVRPRVTETTALGAAYLAGLAVGYWNGRSDVHANWAVDRTFEPNLAEEQVCHRRARWNEALSRARDWEEHSTLKPQV